MSYEEEVLEALDEILNELQAIRESLTSPPIHVTLQDEMDLVKGLTKEEQLSLFK